MKFRVLLVALVYLGLCSSGCSSSSQQPDDEVPSEQTEKAIEESDIIPVGDSPTLGPADAPITIVEFSDFQCPYCARGAKTMHTLVEQYPNDVRVVFKQNPLEFHHQARAASKAAIAAGNQGKFWQMHDWLFANRRQFRANANNMKAWTAGYAKELGLDVAQFEADFDAQPTEAQIDEDLELSKKIGVHGTPHFFINGERIRGAQPLATFQEVVDAKLAQAEKMLEDPEVSQKNLYAKAVAENFEKPEPRKPRPRPQPARKPSPKVAFVPVDADEPMFGNTEDPLVTIVEFSDFQCPFCAKVKPTLNKISKKYGDQVRVVFKQLPLHMHPQAGLAARAALAAHEQGGFWPMHDKLFENQRQMREHTDNFKEWSAGLAQEIGLDVDQFKKDFDSAAVIQKLADDVELAKEVGARGTPNFWINGVKLRGAQPFSAFEAKIDEQIELAKKLRRQKDLTGDALYKAAVEQNKKTYSKEEQAARKKPAPVVDPAKLTVGEAPTKGPDDAPVTIVAFSDFQCPYCKRGFANVEKAMAEHKGSVKLVYKHFPLSFHKQAHQAAKAAMAAGEQGKFWQMHDKLFENQKEMRHHADDFDEWAASLAEQIGLDVDQFKADMKKAEYETIIKEDMEMGKRMQVRGTPAFFINGTRVNGARPSERFETAIRQALDEAK